MKANIEVHDRREADAIRAGLLDPELRAVVVIAGILQTLPSNRVRQRVLKWVGDRLNENVEIKTETVTQPTAGNGQ